MQEPPWPGQGQPPIIVREPRGAAKAGVSISSWRRHIRPLLGPPVRIGPRCIGFWSDRIDAVLASLSQLEAVKPAEPKLPEPHRPRKRGRKPVTQSTTLSAE
jgi:hypothetical protein